MPDPVTDQSINRRTLTVAPYVARESDADMHNAICHPESFGVTPVDAVSDCSCLDLENVRVIFLLTVSG